jgi:glyoxylase-like metal-dependent hydrolase (beta-lactamase superfamily II)
VTGSAADLEVARGVYRLGTRWANFYLVVDAGEGLLVDSGYPGYRGQLEAVAEDLGLGLRGIRGVIVTHHHVDHAGTAEAVRSRAGATVLVGERDAAKVTGQQPSHPPQGFWAQAWRPSMLAYLLHSARFGGARYRPLQAVTTLDGDGPLDLPGRPEVIATPGHTAGHCSVLLEERGVLFTGDAMVNFDYASGTRGLGLHRFNEDRQAAIAALDRLEGADAQVVLFGHGDPSEGGVVRALETVRAKG